MKTSILTPLFLIGAALTAFGQTGPYHIFHLYDSPGIVDTAGKEIWQPNGKFYLNRPRDESPYWIFEGRDTMDMLFNRIIGQQQFYAAIDGYGPVIAGGRYMFMRDTVIPFLLNYVTGRKISLKHNYANAFRKENGYLFATYQEYDTTTKHFQKRVDIFENNEQLQPVLEGEYGWPLFLYKTNTVQKIYTDEVPFDAVVFSNGNRHNLYGKDMKRIKRFVLGKARTEDLVKEATKLLGFKVDNNYTTLHPDDENNTQIMVEAPPERFYPMLDAYENGDGTATVVLKEHAEASRPLFTTTKRVRVYGRGKVHVEDRESFRKIMDFEVDLKTGRYLLPAKYFEFAGMTLKQ